jgi:hypothetical protein
MPSREATKRYLKTEKGLRAARRGNRKFHEKLRMSVFEALGGQRCVRCGYDTDMRVLHFDHKHGGGLAEKRRLGVVAMYHRMIEHPDDYQVLCANCNWIKKFDNNEMSVKRKDATKTYEQEAA